MIKAYCGIAGRPLCIPKNVGSSPHWPSVSTVSVLSRLEHAPEAELALHAQPGL